VVRVAETLSISAAMFLKTNVTPAIFSRNFVVRVCNKVARQNCISQR